ncbi:MAG: RsmE family RNA methyltransferase [Patescibacteria group bacterium]
MRTARFFVPEEWLALSAEAFSIPAGSIHRQIVGVLRMKVGEHISLCPNDGSEIDCVITEITRAAILGSIVGKKTEKPLRPDVVVCAAVTKRDTFEWTLQKCTEIGASAFIPLMTDRVIKKTKDIPPRWLDIVREASEQSGRTMLPIIHAPMSLKEAMEKTKKFDRIVLHESVGKSSTMPTVRPMDHMALFVGPEGGFTDEEILSLAEGKSTVVQLGDLVMRAETAATVATAMIRLS